MLVVTVYVLTYGGIPKTVPGHVLLSIFCLTIEHLDEVNESLDVKESVHVCGNDVWLN